MNLPSGAAALVLGAVLGMPATTVGSEYRDGSAPAAREAGDESPPTGAATSHTSPGAGSRVRPTPDRSAATGHSNDGSATGRGPTTGAGLPRRDAGMGLPQPRRPAAQRDVADRALPTMVDRLRAMASTQGRAQLSSPLSHGAIRSTPAALVGATGTVVARTGSLPHGPSPFPAAASPRPGAKALGAAALPISVNRGLGGPATTMPTAVDRLRLRGRS